MRTSPLARGSCGGPGSGSTLRFGLSNPYWLLRGGAFLLRKLWPVRRELWRRQRVGKITFFVHNFMDASALDPERIRNCALMIMTADGPVSMCQHNARRDDYILKPLTLDAGAPPRAGWNPLSGKTEGYDSPESEPDATA